MTRYFSALLLLAISIFSTNISAQAQQRPDMYVVVFRADWCGPCKIVEPNLQAAMTTLRDPGLEVIVFDITTPASSERSAYQALDRNIVDHYNQWYGTTGFVALVDADTKRTLGCVNMMYSAQDMATHISNLKTYAIANQISPDTTCPAPNGAIG